MLTANRKTAPVSRGARFCAMTVASVLFLGVAPASAQQPGPNSGQSTRLVQDAGSDIHSPNMRLVANLPTGPGGDLAFWGKTAVAAVGLEDGVASNDGFALIDISDPHRPRETGRFLCPGSAETHAGQDISIWSNLVIMSTQARVEAATCHDGSGTGPGAGVIEPGVVIVDISDPARPRRVGNVGTGCKSEDGHYTGAHTHTTVPDLRNDRLIVYAIFGACTSVVEVPLNDPSGTSVVRNIDDIMVARYHDGSPGVQPACHHDLQVYLPGRLAACAGGDMRTTQLWDMSNLEHPKLLSTIRNNVLEHHHSTAFSSDGKTLVLGEENVTTLATDTCTSGTDSSAGALWFYDVSNPTNPKLRSYFQNPVRGPEPTGYCSAHYFNVLPLGNGRDVLVSAWYRSGTVVVDFTDPRNPKTIAYYLAAPGDRDRASFAYASYWYNGFVYVNNMGTDLISFEGIAPSEGRVPQRGFDVMALDDPLVRGAAHLPYLNPGTQDWGGGPNSKRSGADCDVDDVLDDAVVWLVECLL